MAMSLLRLFVALTLIGPVWPTSEGVEVDFHGTPHQKCHGQSCAIAALSGSSGKPYKRKRATKDMTLTGDCCILRYNPSARKRLYAQTPGLRQHCKREGQQAMFERDNDWIEENLEDEIEERAHCAPKTLIFAKGTSETGPLGNSVGPALQQGLEQQEPGQWSFRGVRWHNDEAGNHCLGLPGGSHAAKLLEKTHRKCPHTKIVMSGYSQGAMVVRDGVAYSRTKSHKHLKGIVTFGDPFNGAPVKHLRGPLIVYCNKGDRVCDGRNIITQAHLEYVGKDTDEAIQRIIKLTS